MLKNFKIYSKLFLNTLQIVGMFIIVMVIYTKTNNHLTNGFTGLIDHEMKILEEAENCSIYMLQMRQNEKDFTIHKDPKYIAQHKKNYVKFLNSLKSIEDKCSEAKMDNIKTLAGQIKSKTEEYEDEFKNFVVALESKGFNHNSGLQKTLRDSGQSLESELKKVSDNDKLLVRILTVRKQEKDYLLRYQNPSDAKTYAEATQKAVGDLRQTVEDSTISQEQKEKLDSYMTSYLSGFNDLIKENEKIASTAFKLKEATDKVALMLEGNKGQNQAGIIGEIKSIVENDKFELKSKAETEQNNAVIFALFTILVSLIFSKLITNSITKPLKDVVEAADRLARGDLTKNVDLNRKDEIGQLSNSVNQAIGNLRENINFLIHNSTDIKNASHQLYNVSEELSVGFTGIKKQSVNMKGISANVAQNMKAVKEETNGIANASSKVKDDASLVNSEMITVAASLEESQTNVQSIAFASEQMSSTINEIAENTERCRNIAENAVAATDKASQKVGELSLASSQIEKIILVIEEIAEQTKNLALNATIEAARAGEAGKGFAVVANEVKELARQTNEATVQVKESIMQMSMCSDETVGEIGTIQGVISEVNEIVNSIATAIEEQSITVQENSKNTNQAAEGLLEVTKSVAQVSTRVDDITSRIDSVSNSVHGISEKCTKTDSESTEVLHSIEEIDSAITINNENAIALKDSSNKLSLMSDNLDSLINKFAVDDKDLTHYNKSNNIGGHNNTDKKSKNGSEDKSDIIAARVQSV